MLEVPQASLSVIHLIDPITHILQPDVLVAQSPTYRYKLVGIEAEDTTLIALEDSQLGIVLNRLYLLPMRSIGRLVHEGR